MEILKNYLIKHKLFSDETLKKFADYFSVLLEYNQKFNLTAITDKDEIQTKHFTDSLYGNPFISNSVLDIGSGAGFPGIPLAIVNPDKHFTLVDSLNKRVEFMKTVCDICGLNNVEVLHKRAEELDKTKKFSTVTARAVAPLNILCEYCLPFVEIGGTMLAYKGKKADEEIKSSLNAVKILGGNIESVRTEKFMFGSEENERNLIIIKKERETPQKYPRGGNKPRLKPL